MIEHVYLIENGLIKSMEDQKALSMLRHWSARRVDDRESARSYMRPTRLRAPFQLLVGSESGYVNAGILGDAEGDGGPVEVSAAWR